MSLHKPAAFLPSREKGPATPSVAVPQGQSTRCTGPGVLLVSEPSLSSPPGNSLLPSPLCWPLGALDPWVREEQGKGMVLIAMALELEV